MTNISERLISFQSAIQRRELAEEALRQTTGGSDPREAQLRSALTELLQTRDAEIGETQEAYERASAELAADFDSRLQQEEQEHHQTIRSLEDGAIRSRNEIEQKRDESAWVMSSVLDDTADDSPARLFERFKALLQKSKNDQITEWEQLDAAVTKEMQDRNWSGVPVAEFEDPPRDKDSAAARFNEAISDAREQLKNLKSLILPKFFRGFRSLGLFLALQAAIGFPIYLYGDPSVLGIPVDKSQATWLIFSAIAGAIVSLLLTLVLFSLASMKQSEILRHLLEASSETQWAHQHWLRFAKEQLARQQKEFEVQQAKIQRDRQRSLSRYEQAHEETLEKIEEEKKEGIRIEQRRYAEVHAQLSASRRQELADLEQAHQRRIDQLTRRFTHQIEIAQNQLETVLSERRKVQQTQWATLKSDWEQCLQNFESEMKSVNEIDQSQFAGWTQLAQGNWAPPNRIPDSVRVGEHLVDLNAWEGAVPEDPRLAPRKTLYKVPCGLTFPESTSILFESPTSEAREQAIHGLQSAMLRLLTLLPPGKLRFTIIDPVGLGESFGGFMHLTDYDEMLVTNRIWTEASQIEARLMDLTEHMENVLQKYLRNEFQTIEEYNASAGEVAEPYHVLVISDFPAKFSEIAARRLVSIVNSGPRCGVYTLMNVDPGKQLPNNFSLSDIESRVSRFKWHNDAFYRPGTDLAKWPLTIDAPPPPEEFTSIVKMVGEASKDARRVEVSFARITPKDQDIWAGDSRSELVIPLGRAGATKLQQLRLGKGTSQHMLVAGKTGSGKSTFLHILITNLSLHYSPDEVNFFLIDFKKGVEFKDYATHRLPHARVIAVESDREFGVSALQKLGDVLQERGELFRKHGVQDIAGYRNATKRPLPRILLIVDEFQEFFVEDDKISQNAALLLDRLVRQGRAFGIHVVLGSQTLGGAYSLARSTLGQVAVRVALQCSEADAHLILSEDNTAARLLARPGEAIYNDANGMLEGNHPFQIAWVTDAEREASLNVIQQRLTERELTPEPTIVFEGNIPSDLTRNSHVSQLIDRYHAREEPVLTPSFWLGDAVEIAPETSVTLHRQTGNHLLLVGQDAEAAQGVMGAALVALGASLSPRQEMNSLFVLDGSHAGSPEAAMWTALVETLPVDARLIRPDETSPFMQAMTAELKRREEENDTQAPPIVLLVYHIARFRDLRKAEDDFGMGAFGGGAEKPPSPGKLFADLLAQGPAFGMHCIIWCDSFNNTDRWFSRQSLRELEMRVAFQMNASDSSNLIDSPAASRLGTHRAMLYREETGTAEKFRPYGLPSSEWLETTRRRLLNETTENDTVENDTVEGDAVEGNTVKGEVAEEQTNEAASSTSDQSASPATNAESESKTEESSEDPDIPDLEEFSIQ